MKFISLISCFSLFFFGSLYAVELGKEAPTFSLKGSPSDQNLESHRGKFVVLEWYNEGCPFVRKHYDSKNMQGLQKKYKGKVTWLTINSSAPGKQGFIKDKDAAKDTMNKEQMASLSLLIDSDGKVGQMYKAKTTPHMFIIDPKGKLVYQGAIDSVASADFEDIGDSQNYVDLALTEALAGKEISMEKTNPYGCSVKY